MFYVLLKSQQRPDFKYYFFLSFSSTLPTNMSESPIQLEDNLPWSLHLAHSLELVYQGKSPHWDWELDYKAIQTITQLFQFRTLRLNKCPCSYLSPPFVPCIICVHLFFPCQTLTFFKFRGRILGVSVLPRYITSSKVTDILPKLIIFTRKSRLSVVHKLHTSENPGASLLVISSHSDQDLQS